MPSLNCSTSLRPSPALKGAPDVVHDLVELGRPGRDAELGPKPFDDLNPMQSVGRWRGQQFEECPRLPAAEARIGYADVADRDREATEHLQG